MILVIDIGNSNIVIGIFNGRRLVRYLRMPTDGPERPSFYAKAIMKFVKGAQIRGIIVSSVVPKALQVIKKSLAAVFTIKPIILGENAKVPIQNKYKRPGQVGQDRLVNAYAALKICKKKPAIIVDFGTAVTIDVVSGKGAYLGGVIMPGVELSIENLTRRAALLPRITLRKPKSILGKSTVESMLSGIFYGYASLCDGMIERLSTRLRLKRPIVIVTGGHSRLLSGFFRKIDKIDVHLTLKGLNLIYRALVE